MTNTSSEILPQGATVWPRWKKIVVTIIIFLALVAVALYCYQRFFGTSGQAQTPPIVAVPAKPKAVAPAVKTPDSVTVTEDSNGKPNVIIEWPAGKAPSKRDQNYWERCGKQKGERC